MPSANGEKSPVGLLVAVTIAVVWISVPVTPFAVTGTFFLRSSGLIEIGVFAPPFGIVDCDLSLEPAFPQAATSTAATPTTRIRARMLPPWKAFGCSKADANVMHTLPQGS